MTKKATFVVDPDELDLVALQQKEIERLREANENNLAGWANDRAGQDRKILRLEAERERLKGWLRHHHLCALSIEYGGHKFSTVIWSAEPEENCTCGLAQALGYGGEG